MTTTQNRQRTINDVTLDLRGASWRPRVMREQLAQLGDALPEAARAAIIAEADRLEATVPVLEAELAAMKAALPRLLCDHHGHVVGTLPPTRHSV